MRYVLLFALSVVFSINALAYDRTTKIEGRLTDNKKTELIAATVRCYVNDSIFIKGTTTNGRGEFKLEVPQTDKVQKLVFSYLGYKELTVNIQPTTESVIRLGDIVMKQDAVQIHEVVVLGENQVRTEEKLMVYPTKEELRHAYDGYSALDALKIPGLELDPFDNALTFQKQEVLLCIDGREASKDEVQALNAKYIKRVDIYTMGKKEFPEVDCVIDYIMKNRDYAGTVATYANQQLTRPNGEGRVTAQYYHKKSEFAVSVSDNYNDFKERPESFTNTTYIFPDKTVERTDNSMPAKKWHNNFSTYANYIYKDNIQDFYASLRLNRNESKKHMWYSQTYDTGSDLYVKHENNWSRDINPALQLRYTRALPNNQRIRTELYASFGNNDFTRWYEQSKGSEVADFYQNETEEESRYLKAKLGYTKTFKNKSSLNVELNQDLTHTDNLNLRGNDYYDISLDKSNTKFLATYNYRLKNKFSIIAQLATHISHVSTQNDKVTNCFFIPYIKATYQYKKHSLILTGTAKSLETNNSNRTGDEYRYNEYEIYKGNPELKDYMNYRFTLVHVWTPVKWMTLIQYGTYDINTNDVYYMRYYDDDRMAFVRTPVNQGKGIVWYYEPKLQCTILPKLLYLNVGIGYRHYSVKTWEKLSVDEPLWSSSVIFEKKGWRAMVAYSSQRKGITTGEVKSYRMPASLTFRTSYSIGDFNVELAYRNPFKAISKTTIDGGCFIEYSEFRTPHIDDNYGYVRVNYRFNYGKKKHKFDNTEVTDVNQSTISK